MLRFKMGYCSCKELLINTYSTRLKLYVVFVLMMSLGVSSYGQNTPKRSSNIFFSIHSNLLYDAALIPNVGAEIYLGKNLSLQADWNYAWWKSEKKNKFWQTYGGDMTLRYWFGSTARNKPLTGHHVGIYGQALTYDFELNGHGYQSARWDYGGGIEYGFALPIARRLNLDFSLGMGYLTGKYKKYKPIDTHYVWQATKKLHWFGPTKAEVSLVWLLGRGNYNSRKGGQQ